MCFGSELSAVAPATTLDMTGLRDKYDTNVDSRTDQHITKGVSLMRFSGAKCDSEEQTNKW